MNVADEKPTSRYEVEDEVETGSSGRGSAEKSGGSGSGSHHGNPGSGRH